MTTTDTRAPAPAAVLAELYATAVTRAARPWGIGWRLLPAAHRRAFILAEITIMTSAMPADLVGEAPVLLAAFAVERVSKIK